MFDKKLESAGWNSSGIRNYSLSQLKIDKWILCVSSYPCFNFTGSVFNRGRATELMERYSCFYGDYECYLDIVTSCRFVFIGSILMDDNNEICVHELDFRFGYQSEFQFMYSIMCTLAHKGDSGVGWFIMGFTSVACFAVSGYYETKFPYRTEVFEGATLMTRYYLTQEANSQGCVVSFDPAVSRDLGLKLLFLVARHISYSCSFHMGYLRLVLVLVLVQDTESIYQ
ncbi:uncharacterized protein LOC113298327 isoform X2 [Papaver somniferum]|uniref:uncharacterized protein LOC113298327 isoform X2 n=1 Tax=Papaver somniferum TaxID=3469 RepID=UPI000E6F971D|nr:uncharacterized protein LOC113298327 isoform X2 [Papaver somniferum]